MSKGFPWTGENEYNYSVSIICMEIFNFALDLLLIGAAVWTIVVVRGSEGIIGRTFHLMMWGMILLGVAHISETITFEVLKWRVDIVEFGHRLIVLGGIIFLVLGFGHIKKIQGEKIKILEQSKIDLEKKVRERTAELELAKNKSETLLASIGEGVFGIDTERNIVYFNPQAEVLSGYKSSEVVGKPYHDFLKFIKEKDRSENIEFIRVALKGNVAEMIGRTMLIRKDKRELPVADSASPIKDKEGNILGAIVVFRDATKERELEIARAELVSFASHQLKTPLTYMGWSVETLKKSKSEAESEKIVGEIDKSIEDMKKLVLDVLNISRIEQGTVELKPEPTQLVDIVNDILKESSSTIKQRNVTIEFSKPERPLPELNIDPQYTHEIFKNIISNAIKYTKDKVTMSFERKGDTVLFICSDNGIGIPKDEQSKIFSKFYIASNAGNTGVKGTGIGLSIAKALALRMHGRIWFESEENKGATFYLDLPFFTEKSYNNN